MDDLYREQILSHYREPRNKGQLEAADISYADDNPLCGDQITLYVVLEDDVVTDVAFQGSGCAISQASASLMTTAVKGKTRREAEELFRAFHAMVTAGPDDEPDTKTLGKLAALGGVRQFPGRVKCANLAWHTLHEALAGSEERVSTE